MAGGPAARSGSLWPRLIPFLACLYIPWGSGGLQTDDFAHIERLSSLDSPLRLLDRPDAFGFHRPVTQASLALDLMMQGTPALSRTINIVLHACVIALASIVASQLLSTSLAGTLATTAFALTPKAHPIAALWLSARAELLM